MVKIQRFKWIPMLIQAINEVKNRGEWPVQPKLEQSDDLRGVSVAAPVVKTAAKSGRRHVKHRPQPGSRQRVVTVPKRPLTVEQYRAVLRELRETKQRLAQLTVIDERLNQLQAKLERQWADFMQRVEAQAAKTPTQGRPHGSDYPQDAHSAYPNPLDGQPEPPFHA
ncbi:MAG: hypothetical protein K6T83_13085 [Alicyclobacillus sp.]|nr:hypothetical protein [Alicyclobacillus sp.]